MKPFKELDPILHSQLRLAVMSVLISVKEAEFFCKYDFAESAIVTNAAPNMMASLTTKRPPTDKSGKPCSVLPNAGTQLSGVVTRNDKVTNDMRKTRKLPSVATPGNQGFRAIINPKVTMTVPSA